MANAKKDGNYVPTLLGVSSTDQLTPTLLEVDPITGRLLVTAVITGTINQSSSPTVTTVGDTTSSALLIASNSNRREVEFYNGSSATLYLLKGAGTASSSNYTVALGKDDYYTSNITSAFQGVWSSDAGGSVFITESV